MKNITLVSYCDWLCVFLFSETVLLSSFRKCIPLQLLQRSLTAFQLISGECFWPKMLISSHILDPPSAFSLCVSACRYSAFHKFLYPLNSFGFYVNFFAYKLKRCAVHSCSSPFLLLKKSNCLHSCNYKHSLLSTLWTSCKSMFHPSSENEKTIAQMWLPIENDWWANKETARRLKVTLEELQEKTTVSCVLSKPMEKCQEGGVRWKKVTTWSLLEAK